jgi:hypothetical protein
MRYKRAKIDSLNLSSKHLESMFIYNENYSIEIVKSRGKFFPKIWSKIFGKSLTRNIIEAKIIHTYLGLKLPLKTYAISPKAQTLELAGFHSYNERSKQLSAILEELKSQLNYTRIMRVDIAIDYEGNIPHSIIKALSKHREPFRYRNTTYYKTAKEKKTNQKMDIKIYNKAHKENLDFTLMRLEFVFKPNYLKKVLLKDIDFAIKKMEKSIKKATGLSVKIASI